MRRFADTMTWADDRGFAIDAAVDERLGFIRRTYLHLIGELAGVALVTYITLQSETLSKVAFMLLGNLLIYFAAFFAVSLVSRKLMEGRKSLAIQYAGAGLWIFFLGLLVAPLAIIAKTNLGSYAVLWEGFLLTAFVFGGLTAYVFITRKDFSFLGGTIWLLSWLLVGACVLGVFAGFAGLWMSVLWVALLAGWVLYDTSKVIHHRRVDEHVAASVDLLVDFVYMFIHIVILLMGSRD